MVGAGRAAGRQDITADVVVVGGGGSGLAAGIEAARLGRSVVLLEKGDRLGGSTGRSVGSISANCTPHQIKRGIQDSPDEHFEDMGLLAERRSGAKDNLELRRLYVDSVTDTFRWLMNEGVEFFGPMPEEPHRYPRMHNVLPNSKAYIGRLSRAAAKDGVRITTSARAGSFLWSGQRVAGVTADVGGRGPTMFWARRGVIVATGDYSASREMKLEYAGADAAAMDPVNPLSTGDGQRLLVEAGARILNGDVVSGSRVRFVAPPRKMLVEVIPGSWLAGKIAKVGVHLLSESLLAQLIMKFATTQLGASDGVFAVGAVLVNRDGDRFVDETGDIAPAIPRQPGREAFIVFDADVSAQLDEWPHFISTAPGLAYAYLRDYLRNRRDIVHIARTWSDLADAAGMAASRLPQTIEEYNAASDAGDPDAFGRRTRRRLDRPPFYALGPLRSWTPLTDGGVAVTTRMEVLGTEDAPISGLFAAGSAGQGGLPLEGHGHHIGWAFVSGRVAGRSAALADPVEPPSA